jgi:hypothetical protein
MYLGLALLAYVALSTVLAQTISLNGNNTTEFGQGIFQVTACDTFIGIQLTPTAATYSGTSIGGTPYVNQSRVKNIQFYGLDTKQCAGKNLKIQLRSTSSANPLPLFTDSGSLSVDRALVSVNSNKATTPANALTIINGYGANIGYFDAYEYVSYKSSTAVYTLAFTNPLALMSDVTGVTLESATTG